jgi:hypothetical protein
VLFVVVLSGYDLKKHDADEGITTDKLQTEMVRSLRMRTDAKRYPARPPPARSATFFWLVRYVMMVSKIF